MVGLKVRGIKVRIRISSLDITLSRLYGIKPALVKPPWMFFSIIKVKNTSLNV